MAVPKFFEFFSVVLKILSDEDVHAIREIREKTIAEMQLTKEDISEMVPSGTQSRVDNRITWALAYLKKAELIVAVARGKYRITTMGRDAYIKDGKNIDLQYLNRYEGYRKFKSNSPGAIEVGTDIGNPKADSEETPQDILDAAFKQINAELSDSLLLSIMERTPEFFEKMVVKLLMKMGYGGAFDEAGIVVGKSGDEGIDGIIREDKLGYSNIYIQAKRWDPATTVGRPEIMKFVGALAGQGATKGLFITTAHFSKEAENYVRKQLTTKVVLVDGTMLAKLMIEYGLGVSTQTVYAIKKIDTDFFSEEND